MNYNHFFIFLKLGPKIRHYFNNPQNLKFIPMIYFNNTHNSKFKYHDYF